MGKLFKLKFEIITQQLFDLKLKRQLLEETIPVYDSIFCIGMHKTVSCYMI